MNVGIRTLALSLLLALMLAGSVSEARSQPSTVTLGQLIGDDFNDVRVIGDYAYVAGARGLTVLDVSDPENPQRAHFVDLPTRANDVEIVGGLVYVARMGSGGGVDMFVPYLDGPQQWGALPGPSAAIQMELDGDHLYVAAGGDGLFVFDVSSAFYPVLEATIPMQGEDSLFEILVIESTIYMVISYPYEDYWQTRLIRADVSDPTSPVLDPTFNWTDGPGSRLYSDGVLLYVPRGAWTSLYFLPDLTPAGTIPVAGVAFYPEESGMIVDHDDGVSYLEKGIEISSLELLGWGEGGDRVGDIVYRAGARYGLQLVDVGDPGSPTLRGVYAEPQHLETVIATEDVVYCIGRELYTVDVTDPTTPFVTERDPVYLDLAVLTQSGHLIAAAHSNQLLAYDLSDPRHPTRLRSVSGVSPQQMVERGGLLYMADGAVGLRILDVSDPATGMPEIGSVSQTSPRALALHGDLAYVASDDVGVIYDVSNPQIPRGVGQFPTSPRPDELLVINGHLIVSSEWYGLDVYSLADPLTPDLVLDDLPGAPYRPRGFDVDGIHLAMVDYQTQRLYDMRDPANPVLVLAEPTPFALADDLDLRGDRIHLATGSGYYLLAIDGAVGVGTSSRPSVVLRSQPNPVDSGAARIQFTSPASGEIALTVYDAAGRRVRGWLVEANAGELTELVWNGTDDDGRRVARGTYFLQLRSDTSVARHRMVWLR